MTVRYLRAEELARFANVAKSTVLAAIRRGEIPSSRTVGRGTRISLDAARAYLTRRGAPIPDTLRESNASTIAVVTERSELIERVRAASHASWTVTGSPETYATLLWIGTHAPAIVVVDLDMVLLPAFEVLRAVRSHPTLVGARLVAIGSLPELVRAARELGANDAALHGDDDALARALLREPFAALREPPAVSPAS